MNTWELGLNGGEFGLAAYRPDPGDWVVQILFGPWTGYFARVANFGGDRGYAPYVYTIIPNLTPHFPYGNTVTPD